MEANTIQTLAIAKAIKEDAFKAASKATEIGKYDIDVTVRVVGTVTKGADETHYKPDQTAIMAAIRLAFGASKVDAVIASVAPVAIPASGKVTSKLQVDVI